MIFGKICGPGSLNTWLRGLKVAADIKSHAAGHICGLLMLFEYTVDEINSLALPL